MVKGLSVMLPYSYSTFTYICYHRQFFHTSMYICVECVSCVFVKCSVDRQQIPAQEHCHSETPNDKWTRLASEQAEASSW
jgi:hypothetical protein